MRPFLLLVLLASLSAVACHPPGCHGSDNLQGTVVNSNTNMGIKSALVAIEAGGLDVPITNPSLGSPAYTIGLQTNASGSYGLNVVCGMYGVHAFAEGFEAMGVLEQNSANPTLALVPQNGNGPTIANVTISPSSTGASSKVTLSATVTAASASDPLSQHVLVIGPDNHFGAALNPPSPGSVSSGYPDGVYSAEFLPDPAAGTHTYWVVAASKAGLTAAPVSATVTVN